METEEVAYILQYNQEPRNKCVTKKIKKITRGRRRGRLKTSDQHLELKN